MNVIDCPHARNSSTTMCGYNHRYSSLAYIPPGTRAEYRSEFKGQPRNRTFNPSFDDTAAGLARTPAAQNHACGDVVGLACQCGATCRALEALPMHRPTLHHQIGALDHCAAS